MFNEKRGYFFILDAVLAMFVLVIGVVLIANSYSKVPKPTQVSILSDDLLNFLANTKIKDLNNPYAGIGGELWKAGNITDADNSLLQQIGEFYAEDNFGAADKFIQNVSKNVMPPQFNYEVWINGVMLYPKAPPPEHVKSKAETRILLTSKEVTFGILNKTTNSLWGPYKAEVFVWEK